MFTNRKFLLKLYFALFLAVYLILFSQSLQEITISTWVVIITFTLLTALFDSNPIVLPSGENLALVTPLFFSVSVLYGEYMIFFVSAFMTIIVMIVYPQKWNIHILNGIQYAFASYGGLQVYKFFGGEIGNLDLELPLSFLSYSVVYFIINVTLITIYLHIEGTVTAPTILKVFLEKKNILIYFTVMALGLLMTIVLRSEGITGLLIFSIVIWGMGSSFQNYYKMFDHFRDLSTKDELTGLYNHRYFQETLKESLTKHQSVSLLLLDLDYFKVYNDLFGHPKGDKLLKELSKLLALDTPEDGIICRYGGEEFAIILPDLDSEEAIKVAECIRNRVSSHPFEGVEHMPNNRITVSIGVSNYPDMADNKENIIMLADQALYKIKYTSRNKVQLYSSVIDELKTSFRFEHKEEEVLQTIKTFLTIINSKDRYTYSHTERIMEYAESLAKELGLSTEQVKTVRYAALLHDIGKVEVPTEILNKRSKLTEEEWHTIQMHVFWGEEIVKPIEELSQCLPIIRHHHERFDGKGYPDQLSKTEIPLLARILTIVDSFDAMTTNRPYQKVKTIKEACEELRRCAGTQFDPTLVEPFIKIVQEIHKDHMHITFKNQLSQSV
ncbi:diguanylate cyclase [Bacillus timonensis]|nr:diguanylate cyclase [Bacillus timonensis]